MAWTGSHTISTFGSRWLVELIWSGITSTIPWCLLQCYPPTQEFLLTDHLPSLQRKDVSASECAFPSWSIDCLTSHLRSPIIHLCPTPDPTLTRGWNPCAETSTRNCAHWSLLHASMTTHEFSATGQEIGQNIATTSLAAKKKQPSIFRITHTGQRFRWPGDHVRADILPGLGCQTCCWHRQWT